MGQFQSLLQRVSVSRAKLRTVPLERKSRCVSPEGLGFNSPNAWRAPGGARGCAGSPSSSSQKEEQGGLPPAPSPVCCVPNPPALWISCPPQTRLPPLPGGDPGGMKESESPRRVLLGAFIDWLRRESVPRGARLPEGFGWGEKLMLLCLDLSAQSFPEERHQRLERSPPATEKTGNRGVGLHGEWKAGLPHAL